MKKSKVVLGVWIWIVLIGLSACTQEHHSPQTQQATITASEPAVSTPGKKETVGNDYRQPMEVQLTKEQVKGMFGDQYTELTDAVTGEWKVWRYDVQPKSGYKPETTTDAVDTKGIINQNVKGQVFVTWTTEGKLMSIIYYGLKDGAVSAYYINGFTEENLGS